MKDVIGQTINVGDMVLHQGGGRYPNFLLLTVVKITAKMVSVKTPLTDYNATSVWPEKLVVVTNNLKALSP